jgi:hypothetical protein
LELIWYECPSEDLKTGWIVGPDDTPKTSETYNGLFGAHRTDISDFVSHPFSSLFHSSFMSSFSFFTLSFWLTSAPSRFRGFFKDA